ncbi:hypothetical protein [Streptomyces sp. NBC_00134]|uniref:hypothetical protein n=1 Tax=Streptomyces sp. NBC_00134 TaxID=2975663 RepID=UPI002F91100C
MSESNGGQRRERLPRPLGTSLKNDANSAYNLVTFAVWGTLFVIPGAFALIDDDRLRMSDDYAALVAGIDLAVLLISVVDLHFGVARAKALAATGRPLNHVVRQRRNGQTITQGQAIRAQMATMTVWVRTCAVLTTGLILLTLWAAIEDHGPAPWLAWYTLLTTAWGLAVVATTGVRKMVPDIQEVLDMVRSLPPDPPADAASPSPPASGTETGETDLLA